MFQGVKIRVESDDSQVCSLWFVMFLAGFWLWLNLMFLPTLYPTWQFFVQGGWTSKWCNNLFNSSNNRQTPLQKWFPKQRGRCRGPGGFQWPHGGGNRVRPPIFEHPYRRFATWPSNSLDKTAIQFRILNRGVDLGNRWFRILDFGSLIEPKA